jgi:hypothetical protein
MILIGLNDYSSKLERFLSCNLLNLTFHKKYHSHWPK